MSRREGSTWNWKPGIDSLEGRHLLSRSVLVEGPWGLVTQVEIPPPRVVAALKVLSSVVEQTGVVPPQAVAVRIVTSLATANKDNESGTSGATSALWGSSSNNESSSSSTTATSSESNGAGSGTLSPALVTGHSHEGYFGGSDSNSGAGNGNNNGNGSGGSEGDHVIMGMPTPWFVPWLAFVRAATTTAPPPSHDLAEDMLSGLASDHSGDHDLDPADALERAAPTSDEEESMTADHATVIASQGGDLAALLGKTLRSNTAGHEDGELTVSKSVDPNRLASAEARAGVDGPDLPGDEPSVVPGVVGGDLLADFPPADGFSLGAAVDRFLEQLPVPFSGFASEDGIAMTTSWPIVGTAALIGLEFGRRKLRKGAGDKDDEEKRVNDPGSGLAAWPGSWSARVY